MDTVKVYDFNFDKIMKHCDTKKSVKDQIDYLNRVLIEFEYIKKKHADDFIRVQTDKDGRQYYHDVDIYVDLPDQIKAEAERREAVRTLGRTESSIGKIRWKGTEAQLLYMIKYLVEEGLILANPNQIKAFIRDHFINKYGEPFKNKQLYESEVKKIGHPDAKIIELSKRLQVSHF